MTLRLPTAEQQAISRELGRFLQDNYPLARLRERGTDVASWRALAGMGAFGISLPAADGGLGLSWTDEVLACREAGRQLISPALIGSVLAAHVSARAGLSPLCTAVLSGERRVGIAMRLSSSDLRLFDGEDNLYLLVEPHSAQLVEYRDADVEALSCVDETVRLCAAPSPVSELANVEADDLFLAVRLLAAALLCGLLETTRDMAADYARSRVQFGRPIGVFQAIKHRCADIALAAELCWSQTLYAAGALATGAGDAAFHVVSAKLLAGVETLKATQFNIQAHGAMGFTDEVCAHRLMKRAHVLHQLFEDPRTVPAKLLDLRLDI